MKKSASRKSRKAKSKSRSTPHKSQNKNKKSKRSRSMRAAEEDVIQMILKDHKPLWDLVAIMKDDRKPFEQRRKAFEEFAPLLIAHAKPEEKALYAFMKRDIDLREEGFTAEVEHQLADQLIEEAKRTSDEEQMGARIKVLAEIVEHHLEEEEGEILPDVKRQTNAKERAMLAEKYTLLRREIQAEGSDDAPHERDIANLEGHPTQM